MNPIIDKTYLDLDQRRDYYLYIYIKTNTPDYSKIGITANPRARLRHYHVETLGTYYMLIKFADTTLKQMLKYEKRCLRATYAYRDPTICAIEARKMSWDAARAICLNEIRAELVSGIGRAIEYNESDYPPMSRYEVSRESGEAYETGDIMEYKMAKWEKKQRELEEKYKIPAPDRIKMLAKLYDHQRECLCAVEKEMNRAARAHFILLMGAGKTEILKAYIVQNHYKYGRIYVIYNTDTLRDQNKLNYNVFKNYNIDIKMWSYQKLYNGNWGDIDKPDTLIIFDEFHHITNTITDGNNKTGNINNLLKFGGHVLSCTATPKYVSIEDEDTRAKLYGRCVYNYENCSYERLIIGGYVVPTLYYVSARDSGEIQTYPENKYDDPKYIAAITQCITNSIVKMAAGDAVYKHQGRKFIIFTKDTYECDAVYKLFMHEYDKSGIKIPRENVFISHSNLSRGDRIDIEKYKVLDTAILFNCREFGEGFDNPSIDSVIMTYDTSSIEYFIQFFGRAIRVNNRAPGKIARMCVVAWNCDVKKIIENIVKKIQSVGLYHESDTRFYYTAYFDSNNTERSTESCHGSSLEILEDIRLIRIHNTEENREGCKKIMDLLAARNIRNYTQFRNSDLFKEYGESPAKKYACCKFRWLDHPNIYTLRELKDILRQVKTIIDTNKIKLSIMPKSVLSTYKQVGIKHGLIDVSRFYDDLDIEDMYCGAKFTDL